MNTKTSNQFNKSENSNSSNSQEEKDIDILELLKQSSESLSNNYSVLSPETIAVLIKTNN